MTGGSLKLPNLLLYIYIMNKFILLSNALATFPICRMNYSHILMIVNVGHLTVAIEERKQLLLYRPRWPVYLLFQTGFDWGLLKPFVACAQIWEKYNKRFLSFLSLSSVNIWSRWHRMTHWKIRQIQSNSLDSHHLLLTRKYFKTVEQNSDRNNIFIKAWTHHSLSKTNLAFALS